MPIISVNISCYNRSQMLRECLESFINQTFREFEIIVIDDGSEEDLTFAATIDNRTRYYTQKHGGMARGLNLARKKSNGDFILPFGSDDIALPTLLEETYNCLMANPDFDVVYTDCFIVNRDGGKIRHKHPEYLDTKEAYQQMLKKQYISHGGTLWKKECYPEYDETVGSAEDLELFLTAMENGVKFKLLPKRLWLYRTGHKREAGSESQNKGAEKVLNRRGYTFDLKTRTGKPCN